MTKASRTQFPDNRNGLPVRARGKVALGWTALVILLLAAILTPFLLFERQVEAALGAVFAAALLTTFAPAARAARVQPAEALRYE